MSSALEPIDGQAVDAHPLGRERMPDLCQFVNYVALWLSDDHRRGERVDDELAVSNWLRLVKEGVKRTLALQVLDQRPSCQRRCQKLSGNRRKGSASRGKARSPPTHGLLFSRPPQTRLHRSEPYESANRRTHGCFQPSQRSELPPRRRPWRTLRTAAD
jgi:hypothetical protein